jgi:hypothetical protein
LLLLLLLLPKGLFDVLGLPFWFENGLVPGLLLLLLLLPKGLFDVLGLPFWFEKGFVSGFVKVLAEVVGAGAETPVLGCVVGPTVEPPLHRPNVQVAPMPHMLLHDPQFRLSLDRSTHPAKQRVCP